MTDDILREDKDGVIVLSLNRPAKRNAMTIAMRQAGTRSIAEINRSYVIDRRLD